MTDWELLQKFVHEDSGEAMCELMQRHIAMVHSAALREVRDSNKADDVTQAVFLVLMRKAKTIKSGVRLSGWLFKVTRYAAADSRREQRRREHHEREAGMRTSRTEGDQPGWQEIEPHLNEAIARLRAADQSLLVMRYLEGRSIGEIAMALSASEETTRQRLSRSLDRLRKQLVRKRLAISVSILGVLLLDQTAAQAAAPLLQQSVASTILGTTVASGSSQALALGVLRMIHRAKWTMTAGAAGSLLAMAACIYLIVGALRADDLPKGEGVGVAATATAPAAAKYAPGKTPRETVTSAYAAAKAGDEKGFLSCYDKPTDKEIKILQNVVLCMHAMNSFSKAIVTKFGASGLESVAGLSVSSGDIAKAKEKIDGDKAVVALGNVGPGDVPLVKIGDAWKIQGAVLSNLNTIMVGKLVKQVPAINTLEKDVKDGKYATAAEAQEALMKLLQADAE